MGHRRYTWRMQWESLSSSFCYCAGLFLHRHWTGNLKCIGHQMIINYISISAGIASTSDFKDSFVQWLHLPVVSHCARVIWQFCHSPLYVPSIENVSLAEDALQCLQGISSSCTGCRHLLRPGYSTLQALGKCFCTQTSGAVISTHTSN